MVKLTGPGLAKGASGSLASQLTFSNWKGRAYLKKHRSPKQPRTKNQVSMRLMLGFLSAQWNALDQTDKDTWNVPAEPKNISPFNAYNAHNLQRWRNFQAPSTVYPATETGTSPAEANWGVDCLGDHAVLRLQISSLNDGWGLGFFAGLSPATPDEWFELINAQRIFLATWHYFDFRPDQSGTYVFAFHTFTTDGKFTRDAPRLIAACALTV